MKNKKRKGNKKHRTNKNMIQFKKIDNKFNIYEIECFMDVKFLNIKPSDNKNGFIFELNGDIIDEGDYIIKDKNGVCNKFNNGWKKELVNEINRLAKEIRDNSTQVTYGQLITPDTLGE